jgi:ribosomal protein S10
MAIAIVFSSFDTIQAVNQKPALLPNQEEVYTINKTPEINTLYAVRENFDTQTNVVHKGVNFAMSSAKTNGTLYLSDSQIIQIWS